ncbi:MAG: PhnD/SsuA/transferrin family substrate-binding protein [Nitrospirota bacterium]
MLALLLTPAFLPGGPPGAAGATVPSASTTYSIGIIPFYGPEQIWRLYTPFIDYLNKTTALTWELKLYHSHDSIIDALCSNEIFIALLGPAPLGRAYQKCRTAPLVVSLGRAGKPFYRYTRDTGR